MILLVCLKLALVSIHAPVMGANSIFLSAHLDQLVSIHAPVMGAKSYYKVITCMAVFQSTHP